MGSDSSKVCEHGVPALGAHKLAAIDPPRPDPNPVPQWSGSSPLILFRLEVRFNNNNFALLSQFRQATLPSQRVTCGTAELWSPLHWRGILTLHLAENTLVPSSAIRSLIDK